MTVTKEYENAEWFSRKDMKSRNFSVDKHVHYRLVLGVVGRPLKTLRDAYELFRGGLDVLKGMFILAFSLSCSKVAF